MTREPPDERRGPRQEPRTSSELIATHDDNTIVRPGTTTRHRVAVNESRPPRPRVWAVVELDLRDLDDGSGWSRDPSAVRSRLAQLEGLRDGTEVRILVGRLHPEYRVLDQIRHNHVRVGFVGDAQYILDAWIEAAS